jgi:hypothetical protein
VVAAALLPFAAIRPAAASVPSDDLCRELGLAIGLVEGTLVVLLTSLVAPAVGSSFKPGLRYWTGFGYAATAGLAGSTIMALSQSRSCTIPDRTYLPAVVGASAAVTATVLWVTLSNPSAPRQVALGLTPTSDTHASTLALRVTF